jgi:RNA polymerase sigma-70 factor (ECF subfamily)
MQTSNPPMDSAGPDVAPGLSQDALYQEASRRHGRDVARFVAGYEREPSRRQELLQEVHLALWQSFAVFRGQCSLRTWVYRIAHNTGATHIQRSLRAVDRDHVVLEDIEDTAAGDESLARTERRLDLERVFALIHRLGPLDREVMLLYLEDLDAAGIGEVTGLSASNVATKVHRIKKLLALQLGARGSEA